MEEQKKNPIAGFCRKISKKVKRIFQGVTHSLGRGIYDHPAWFAGIPPLMALILGAVALAPKSPSELFSNSVNEIFAVDSSNHEMQKFEKAMFGDTWVRVGYSENSGHVMLRSKGGRDLLDEEFVADVLSFHEVVASLRVYDQKSGRNITFGDVCIKRPDANKSRRMSSLPDAMDVGCFLDPLIDILITEQRFRQNKSANLEFSVVDDLTERYAIFAKLTASGEIPTKSAGFGYYLNPMKTAVEVFLGTSLGLVDHERGFIISARVMRISYLLQDGVANNTAGLWLRELERAVLGMSSERFDFDVLTTESLAIHWDDLVDLEISHVVFLGATTFLFTAILVGCSDSIFFAIFIAVCATVSIVLTLCCTYTIHRLSIEILRFNFVQCAIFISVFQSIIEVRLLKGLLLATESNIFDSEIKNCGRNTFVDKFHKTSVSCYFCCLVFFLAFSSVAVGSAEIPSLRYFSLTCCVGFCINMVLQGVYFPACGRLFEDRLRQPMAVLINSRDEARLSDVEHRALIEQSEPPFRRQRMRRNRVKARRPTLFQKLKKKLIHLSDGYFDSVVTTYARPITILFYLTYISFAYVGSLYFTERMEPRYLLPTDAAGSRAMVVSPLAHLGVCVVQSALLMPCLLGEPNSSAHHYFVSLEEDFRPFGPRFVVMGQFRGPPWHHDVIRELHKIDKGITSSLVVCNDLPKNWFGEYMQFSFEDVFPNADQYAGDMPPEELDGEVIDEQVLYLDQEGMAMYEKSYQDEVLEYDFEPPDLDWLSLWMNFTATENFKVNFTGEIEFGRTNVLKPDDLHNNSTLNFRWVYQVNDSLLHGERMELIKWFDQLIEERNKSVIPTLYIESFELDWWRTNQNKLFNRPILFLSLVGIVSAGVSLKVQSVWYTFFTTLMAVSTSFGVSGLLTFLQLGLDPFTFPCVLFALPYSIVVYDRLLQVFSEGTGGGRSNWARIALRQVADSLIFCVMSIVGSSLILARGDFYGSWAALAALFLLAAITSMHAFFFLPVMLTIFPPSKKASRGLAVKAAASPRKTQKPAPTQIQAVADSRPHLHARRFYYDTQRAVSFQSEDEDGRIEHITCL